MVLVLKVTGLGLVALAMDQPADAPELVDPEGAGVVTAVVPCLVLTRMTSHGAAAVQVMVLVPVFLMVMENALMEVEEPPAVAPWTTWMLVEVAAPLASE
jgi:hypothetical protein